MQYILSMHELYPLADLPHEDRARSLRQNEVFVYYSLEQLSACDPEERKETLVLPVLPNNYRDRRLKSRSIAM